MFLGASEAQIPPIKYAKKEGYYVISCDRKKIVLALNIVMKVTQLAQLTKKNF